LKLISLRRKTRFGSSKGVSTVIATIFLVLTVFVLSTNVFLWSLSQNALYNQAVKERNQQDVNRLLENIIATNATYWVPSPGTVNVTADLVNAGSISAQIVTLWVLDATQRKYNVTDLRASNFNLNPGDRRLLSRTVQIPGAVSANAFSAWIVTARGNKVNLATVQTVIVADVAQGIGSMALNFYAFRYFRFESGTKLANYPGGTTSFNVPSSTYIAFGALLTNLDPIKQTIILNKYSQVWIYFPQAPGQNRLWYIVNVDSNGNIASSYSSVSIAYRETKLIIFASGKAGSFSSSDRVSILRSDDACALNLLLLGTMGTRDYAQNIPFVSLYVTP